MNKQEEIIEVDTRVEYTPLKLHEKETRAWKHDNWNTAQVLRYNLLILNTFWYPYVYKMLETT